MHLNTRISLNGVAAALATCFFLFSPFTWSHFARLGDMLVRPMDMALLGLILVSVWNRNLGRAALLPVAPFLVISVLLLVRAAGYSDASAAMSAAKIAFYALGTACLSRTVGYMAGQPKGGVNRWVLRGLLTYLAALSGFAVVHIWGMLNTVNPATVSETTYWTLHSLFQVNFFGPDSGVDVNHLSFRNSMAGGLLVASLFLYFIKGRVTGAAVVFFIVAALAMSRSVWIAQAVFVLSHLIHASWRMRLGSLGVILSAALAIGASKPVATLLGDRALSASTRSEALIAAMPQMGRSLLLGTEQGAMVTLPSGEVTVVHNVMVALTLEVGVLGGVLVLVVLAAILAGLVRQVVASFSGRGAGQVCTSVILATGTLLLLRPLVSSSYENVYTLGEWAGFALFVAAVNRAPQGDAKRA